MILAGCGKALVTCTRKGVDLVFGLSGSVDGHRQDEGCRSVLWFICGSPYYIQNAFSLPNQHKSLVHSHQT